MRNIILNFRSIFCFIWSVSALIAFIHNSVPHSSNRLKDFKLIANALEQYKAENGSYPSVVGAVNYDVKSNNSDINWIPGLVPKYLAKIPIDPRKSTLPNQQYLYFSNGKDYKFIAHGAEDVQNFIKTYPDMVDPIRSTYAYGVWTVGGKLW